MNIYLMWKHILNLKIRNASVSEHVPIIPVVHGGGQAPLASSKATVGVAMNNKQSYAWKMDCVEDTHRETLKSSCANCATYESATTLCVAHERIELATTLCVAHEPNETITMMHRRNDQILPPSQYVRLRTEHNISSIR